MGALSALSVTLAGATPAPVPVSASDTIAASQMGPNGCHLRVINGNAAPDVVTVVDPNKTVIGSSATNPSVSVPATTGIREILIPLSAIDQATQLATIQHSVTATVTCEVRKV